MSRGGWTRPFSLSPYSTDYLMLVHKGCNTYKCATCNAERKIVKRGYGKYVHEELKKYKNGFGKIQELEKDLKQLNKKGNL